MKNLTKENFWNKMMEKYPLAMKDFCNWIDSYKHQYGWGSLFSKSYHSDPDKNGKKDVKFHDLPLAMQMGIWNEYLDSYSLEICKKDIEVLLSGFEEGLQEIQIKS